MSDDNAEADVLPVQLADYLSSPLLTPLWDAVVRRLESNGHHVGGQVSVHLDADGAHALAGILPRPVRPGLVNVRLAELDTMLRASPAQRGLVAVTAQLRGTLANRPAQRAARHATRENLLARIDSELSDAGLADATWVPSWIDALRRAGTLTRAGEAAEAEAVVAIVALGVLARTSATWLTGDEAPELGRHPHWELASLASHVGGDAHCLDGDRLAGTLVLRASATADSSPQPTSAAGRRAEWERLGVATDTLSGTVLTWGLTGVGESPWADMMARRAAQGLVSHLTVYELAGAAAGLHLVESGQVVFCCENPQLMQAAAAGEAQSMLVCLSGNPSAAGMLLVESLVRDGADLRYHGDFDWPGVAIAGRVIDRGASAWRFGAEDYLDAVRGLPESRRLPLTGRVCATAWDQRLRTVMAHHGVAVHEESLRGTLLADLG